MEQLNPTANKRIALVAEDLVKYWEARYAAMESKAMVVCMSRRICVELYKAILKLRPDWHHDDGDKGTMKIVMSGSAYDPVLLPPKSVLPRFGYSAAR